LPRRAAGALVFLHPAAEYFAAAATNMTTNLPLIRLSVINPFLLELSRRGIDPRPMLHGLGLPTDVPASHDLFVASETVYELVEKCADLAQDNYLGFTIGDALDLAAWDPFAKATENATTVGELLTMFAVNAADHSSATRFQLSTDGERSTFGFERVRKPAFRPAQNDAFYMGFMLRLLKHATREHWDAASVLFTVAEPDCIPANSEIYRIAKGGRAGVQISFPSQWLFERFRKSQFKSSLDKESSDEMPRSLLDSIRTALRPHLHQVDLTAAKAAKICGHDRRRLSRELREMGTTLSKEISKLRADKASRDLVETDHPVAEIAEAVGFMDPTVFSRAFKNWTGQSPREYRRSHRSPG
jgi:AraC-like DNA-binding protein